MSNPAVKAEDRPQGTLVSIFFETAATHADRPAARYKKDGRWVSVTWKEMEEAARRLARALIASKVQPGDTVALIGNTTYPWVLCELAIHMAGAKSVPIYASLTAEEVEYQLNDAGCTFAFAQDEGQVQKFKETREKTQVREVVHIEGAGEDEYVVSFDDFAARGDENEEEGNGEIDRRVEAIDPEETAVFIYTSGTTGKPKGVMLTHANWAYEAWAISKLRIIRPEDEQLIYLPLSHSFGQVLKTAWFREGHAMAFAESIDKLVDNIGEVRPTVMGSVPRIFEKIFTKVVSSGVESPGLKGKLFRWAMDHFERYAEARSQGRSYGGLGFTLAQKLVFSKVAERLNGLLGGRLRYFVSGGAPLSPKIMYFFELADIKILEGYGLTETSAATCVNRPEKIKPGTVGPPVPGTEIRIAEDGEILIRGPGVMKGYHNRPEETKEAIEPDGWFHSGDIGELDEDGYLKITDRKKDIIVTAGGKNIAPQNLENQLKTHPLISQVVVHGDKRKFLSALITVDADSAAEWARKQGLQFSSYEELTRLPELRAEIQKAVDELNAHLASYETIKKFAILEKDFSIEDGTLTPSLKVKRREVEKRYAEILDGFYNEKY